MSKTRLKLEHYMDHPIPSSRSILGILKSELSCRVCNADATRFAVIKRRFNINPNRIPARTVHEVVVGFFCDECAGDVDELAIAGESIE